MTPLVCCICPSHLPGYAERAKACFDAQTYENKLWLPMDTRGLNMTVGAIRNSMLRHLLVDAPLIAHFDHDDWSAPTRVSEQVAFMERTGAQVVGYGDMPFYDVDRDAVLFYDSRNPRYALGTSLMYRREAWEREPFPDKTPEDTHWCGNGSGAGKVFSQSSFGAVMGGDGLLHVCRLQMVQTIHKGNASPKRGARFQPASAELERAVRSIIAQNAIHA